MYFLGKKIIFGHLKQDERFFLTNKNSQKYFNFKYK